MQKDRGLRSLALVAIVIAVVGLAVGYSALSRTLTINATTKVKGSTWDVHFDDTSMSAATINGLATQEAEPTISSTNVTVNVSLTQPGDSISYTFDVKNAGTLDAELSAAPTFAVTGTAPADLIYTLEYVDAITTIAAGDPLDNGDTKTLKLTISLDPEAESVAAATDTELTLSTTMLYVQK